MKVVEYFVVCDTREQKPLWEDTDIVRKKLDVGDYSILGMEDKIAIERKNCADAYGTFTAGMERFKKEIERAKSYDYFAIMIEGSFGKMLGKKFTNSKFIKVPGKTVMATLNTLRVKYGVPVIFCQNRTEMKKEMTYIFQAYLRWKLKEVKK